MELKQNKTNIGDFFFQAIVIETRPPSSIQKFLSQKKKRKHLAFFKKSTTLLSKNDVFVFRSLWTFTFYLPFFPPFKHLHTVVVND